MIMNMLNWREQWRVRKRGVPVPVALVVVVLISVSLLAVSLLASSKGRILLQARLCSERVGEILCGTLLYLIWV